MSVTLTVTNTSATASLPVPELYTVLAPSGSVTITRSIAQIDSMVGLKALVNAGSASVDLVRSTDDEQIMSAAVREYGTATAFDVSSVAVVTSPVVFTHPFDVAVTPKMKLTIVQNTVLGFKAQAYIRSLTNTGFTVALDVTTLASGAVTGENPVFAPAEDGVALGPFATTLAKIPLTSAAITVHWTESTVAKSATITGTSTLGGVNAANLASATLNRTTGALSLTFAMGHAPDANSITVDYTQVHTADVNWVAEY